MKTTAFCILLIANTPFVFGQANLSAAYHIDLTHFDADSFFVSFTVRDFPRDTAYFIFPATAPGTYQTQDAGRYVGDFEAFDQNGRRMHVTRLSTNVFQIDHSQVLHEITYRVDDTFDSAIKENGVIPAAGSNLEKDNAVINAPVVLGFLRGFQSLPVAVSFQCPKAWTIASALPSSGNTLLADSYDHLADSPIMLGDLTHEAFRVDSSKIDVYCYSQQKLTSAALLLDTLKHIILATKAFLGFLPVDHYAFLFHFRQEIAWYALEHNYSSFYTTPENNIMWRTLFVAPHEFLHVITPLNIHSDIIETFNFEKPTASRHLWLYEGVTDWAASMAKLRANLIKESDYLDGLKRSLSYLDQCDSNVSVVDASLGCYDQYKDEWAKAYPMGELAAILIDVRLLELSKGKQGFRDVLVKLLHEYGNHRAFPDSALFDIIGKNSYPEIRTFLNTYIGGTRRLPVGEYFAKIGYEYHPRLSTGRFRGKIESWSAKPFSSANGVAYIIQEIIATDSLTHLLEPQRGDTVIEFVYRDRRMKPRYVYEHMRDSINVGDEFGWVVSRQGKRLALRGKATQEEIIEEHVFVLQQNLTEEQQMLRRWWLTNRL